MEQENLGPAERIIQTALAFTDHAVHNRPGIVIQDERATTGVRWYPVTHKVEEDQKVVYRLDKVGNKTRKVKMGVLQDDGTIKNGAALVGRYQPAGLFQEVVVWLYRKAVQVWEMDNEFSAHWASYSFGKEHRDMKVILAALMLVQSRKGDPVLDEGKVAFHDEDFRDVGEAMVLLGKDFNPKLLLRVHDVLSLPEIAVMNRELGFGNSARKPFLGRWSKVVEKWLKYREQNPKMLDGLVKAGFRTTVMQLCRRVGYKPESPAFFETLRWRQAQAKDGRREMAIGQEVKAAESWEGLDERAICERIVADKTNYKRVVGLVPKAVGLTRAIVAATIEAGGFSNKDLIIAMPTLEDLGLLNVQEIRERVEQAVKGAEDMRAANIATRVKSKESKELLNEAADNAVKAAVAEVVKGLRIYFIVDTSSSMSTAIQEAKRHLTKFVQGFPKDQIHISTFTTQGREIEIKHWSGAGVENAFRGIRASGATDYGAGIRVLQHHKPTEDEDVLFIFVGDEEAMPFAEAVQASGLNPLAFGLLRVRNSHHTCVQDTAVILGIPCFMIDEQTFTDPYAIPRTIRALVAATPVNITRQRTAVARVTLVEQILNTKLLQKPAWAAA